MSVNLKIGLAGNIVGSAGQELVRSLFGVAQLVAESADNVRVNKNAALALSRQVNELVTVVATELERFNDEFTDDWLHNLADFQQVLSDAQELLVEREGRSYLSQILHQERDTSRLMDISTRVKQAFSILMLQSHVQTQILVDSMLTRATENAAALDALDDHASDTLRSKKPAVSASSIPPPSYYFGRAAETQRVISIFDSDDPAYVAVLGGPGMGKTSLAIAVGNDPVVKSRFGDRRYFIACDAADGKENCLGIIAGAFGLLSGSSQTAKKALTALLGSAPTLLLLDNFESAWEAPEHRASAEEVLQLLSDIPDLSFIVTMRGSERPLGVSWSRPLLPPLAPLDTTASKQAFLSICDRGEDDFLLPHLLKPLEGVPLAITLMASLAQFEPIDALLARWQDARTAMLRKGEHDAHQHKSTSLDLSIATSLESPRLRQVPDAEYLLTLLSLLPNGAFDADIRSWTAANEDYARSLSTLLQTALSFRSPEGRIRVMTPIREFMLSARPPSESSMSSLLAHYFGLAELIYQESKASSHPDAVAIVAPEVDNIASIIRYALRHTIQLRPAIQAAARLCRLYKDTGIGSADLLSGSLAASRAANFDDLTAELVFLWAMLSYNNAVPGDPTALYQEARSMFERLEDVNGIIDTTSMLTMLLPPEEAIAAGTAMRKLAEERNDHWRITQCNQRLADVYARTGRIGEARACHERAIVASRAAEKPNYRLIAYSSYRIASYDFAGGNLAATVSLLQEALPLAQATNAYVVHILALELLGATYYAQGDMDAAIEQLQLGVTVARTAGATPLELNCLLLLAFSYVGSDREAPALETLGTADSTMLALGEGWTYAKAHSLHCRGLVALNTQDFASARAALQSAISTARTPDRVISPEYLLQREAEVRISLGQVELAEDGNAEALACFVVAALVQRKMEAHIDVLRALLGIAESLDDDAGQLVLDAIILPMHRFTLHRTLADALMCSAGIAHRRGELCVARQRARKALRLYEETKNYRGMERAHAFLGK
ncbi:hypothetical protein EXIGLDRAFT_212086 [Exidia glandulosa HHB12029]|uniref:AAA+ ATPase domain-containing protein n=1 Tax=Exidia glandulosa HHB12029 TaxID=1314781 RepID=A0A165EJC6_EXIGL|nr:hypothetical protein EXIGLDRAFT_212086 [Exidia glandulosa HHB12029]